MSEEPVEVAEPAEDLDDTSGDPANSPWIPPELRRYPSINGLYEYATRPALGAPHTEVVRVPVGWPCLHGHGVELIAGCIYKTHAYRLAELMASHGQPLRRVFKDGEQHHPLMTRYTPGGKGRYDVVQLPAYRPGVANPPVRVLATCATRAMAIAFGSYLEANGLPKVEVVTESPPETPPVLHRIGRAKKPRPPKPLPPEGLVEGAEYVVVRGKLVSKEPATPVLGGLSPPPSRANIQILDDIDWGEM